MIYLSSIDIFFKGEIYIAFFFGLISFMVLYIAYKKGFFQLSKSREKTNLKAISVIKALIIYIILSQFMVYFILFFIRRFFSEKFLLHSQFSILSWVNFILLFFTSIVLFLYLKSTEKTEAIDFGLYLNKRGRSSFIFGIIAWIIATPTILFFSQTLDILTYILFQPKQIPEQIAVTFIKKTMQTPILFFIASISVTILAPFVEEIVFRGFFQTWLKKILGVKAAILIASIGFAFFHFSIMQGVGNIPIIGALFLLSCFLGFVYEKKKSLIAPMTLHATFNLMSIFNLYMVNNNIT